MLTAVITIVCCGIGIFTNVDMSLFFFFNLVYSMSLYGQSFFIVAFIPTKKSSGIAATLFHMLTYYIVFIIRDPSTSSGIQYGLSFLPNICMNQIIKQVFFFNFNTSTGLRWNNMTTEYQGYSFSNGLLVMFADTVIWMMIGLYFD